MRLRSADCNAGYVRMARILRGVGPRTVLRDIGYGSLSKGYLEGDVVKCPLHNRRFNVRTGEVLEDPAEENLRTYSVRIEGRDILVGLAKKTT